MLGLVEWCNTKVTCRNFYSRLKSCFKIITASIYLAKFKRILAHLGFNVEPFPANLTICTSVVSYRLINSVNIFPIESIKGCFEVNKVIAVWLYNPKLATLKFNIIPSTVIKGTIKTVLNNTTALVLF